MSGQPTPYEYGYCRRDGTAEAYVQRWMKERNEAIERGEDPCTSFTSTSTRRRVFRCEPIFVRPAKIADFDFYRRRKITDARYKAMVQAKKQRSPVSKLQRLLLRKEKGYVQGGGSMRLSKEEEEDAMARDAQRRSGVIGNGSEASVRV